jgi:hypothetical protein
MMAKYENRTVMIVLTVKQWAELEEQAKRCQITVNRFIEESVEGVIADRRSARRGVKTDAA